MELMRAQLVPAQTTWFKYLQRIASPGFVLIVVKEMLAMDSVLGKTARVFLGCLFIIILGRIGWNHRNDAWVQGLVRPDGPAKLNIQFDNGSVRDVLPGGELPHGMASGSTPEDAPGKLRKCLRGTKVIYTDQTCPTGMKAEAVTGGNVTVLESSTPKSTTQATPQEGRRTLRDALDVSGNDNIKDKMMERAIGK
jgi:hypothetical protein